MELDQILKDDVGKQLFMEFLKKEFSQENLEFWIDCQRFKNITNNDSMKKSAREIYEKYVSMDGPKTINVDSSIVQNIKNNLDQPNARMFDAAARDIFELMNNDPYPRFLQTSQCRNYLSKTINLPTNANRKRKSGISPMSTIHHGHNTDHFYENCTASTILARKWSNNRFINVFLPDGTKEYVSSIQNSSVDLVVQNLLIKRQQIIRNFKVFSICDNQEIDLSRNISSLFMTDIRVEFIVNFSLKFPEGYLLQIECNPNKLAYYTIESILSRLGICFEDIELITEMGMILYKNSLLKSVSILDNSVININYLSSLRTLTDFNVIHELNQLEDGIMIKSVKLKKRKSRPNSRSYDFCSIDCHNQPPNNREKCPVDSGQQNKENYYENVNVGNLSFSNDIKTDEFLKNLMISEPKNGEFRCPKVENYYENVQTVPKWETENKSLHHARLVLIDEPYYENKNAINMAINDKKKKMVRFELNQANLAKNHDNCSPCPSPYTKYLTKPKRNNHHLKRMDQTSNQTAKPIGSRLASSSIRSLTKPDLIPISPGSNKSAIKTLSRFHKIL